VVKEAAMTRDTLPDERGCVRLVTAFWDAVRGDLRLTTNRKCFETVRWVEQEGRGFDFWCHLSGADPDAVRQHLRAEFPRTFALFGRR
jgi:hypothetical protein